MGLAYHTARTQASASPSPPWCCGDLRRPSTYAPAWNYIDTPSDCSTIHIGSRLMLRTNSASAQSVFVSPCSASNLSISISIARSQAGRKTRSNSHRGVMTSNVIHTRSLNIRFIQRLQSLHHHLHGLVRHCCPTTRAEIVQNKFVVTI